jgi:collagenase-like PrtC family protease
LIREASKDVSIEISTIAHLDTITQIKYYRDMFGVDKICGNLLKNRNIKFLSTAAEWCNKNGVMYELMVNEFCGVGGEDYTTHCTYRDSCYIQHAVNETKEDALAMNNYPMEYCIWARKTDVSSWLKLRFVRPEDIFRYAELGINNFKITGRTGSTDYIAKMCEAYLSQNWEGNLLGLWKPLETIYTEQSELEFKHETFIDNKRLNKFLIKWFKNPDFKCEEEMCGESCTYCHDFYDVRLNEQNKEYQKVNFVKKYDFSVE